MIFYWPGIVFSVAVHLLLVALLAWNWQSTATPEITTPRHIKAKLVKLDLETTIKPDVKPSIDEANMAEQRRRRAAAEEKQRELERQKMALAKKQREAQERRQKEIAKKESMAIEQAQRQKRERQERLELAQRQQAIADELAREKEHLLFEEQVRTDKSISQSYSALIAGRIEQNWSRPPSAKQGMQCELEIHMAPNGHIINVRITKSSGNEAFDRSAIQAVKKIERFNEIKDIPSRVFEQYFRSFKLNFNPKDLPV